MNQEAELSFLKCLSAFCMGDSYFSSYGIENVKTYQWPKKGPSLDELLHQYDPTLRLEGSTNYEKNVSLKILLSDQYSRGNLDLDKVSKWIISSWGKKKKISKNLDEYLTHVKDKKYPNSLEGVASYSKLFAMLYPLEFAIYDARVAVSLNVIQLLSEEKQGIFFPYLSGRNRITGYQNTGRGFSNIGQFKKEQIERTSQKNWIFLSKRNVYQLYNSLLLKLCKQNACKLWDIEMLLFSKAEDLVLQIKDDTRFKHIDWSPLTNK